MKSLPPLFPLIHRIVLPAALLCGRLLLAQSPLTIDVKVDQPGAPPMQIGVFFEDINFAGDGGLYPERIKNRSFEFTESLMGWKPIERGGANGSIAILVERPLHAQNPHYLRLASDSLRDGLAYGLANDGFFGIGVQKGDTFTFSLYGRTSQRPAPRLAVEISSADGRPLARDVLRGFDEQWGQRRCTLSVRETDPDARLNLWLIDAGSLDLDMISLFPNKTWKKRPNGLRPDLVQWLADLKPAFLRFPGGCIVEGRRLHTRYQWKTTIGDLAERTLIINRWNNEFKHRPAPDYFQSFGLGFLEYFQLCEDLGAEPMPILNCGMACQFNSSELVPLDELDPYIQDALDLIEFANGPPTSPWGARRVALGHLPPFQMKYLGVGNEQWGPQYIERYVRFAEALKTRHPEIQLVASAGPRPDDDRFQFLRPQLRELKADIVDEHCYDAPAWFLNSAFRYDEYDRRGPRVFMGEYAAQSVRVASPDNRNNWECALAEAAFLTGMERNSEVVTLSSYAPLFGHEEGWQWRPNLIWFDNLRSYATPNYYVQQLFSVHRGDAVLPVQVSGQPRPSAEAPGLYASASREEKSSRVLLKVVNASAESRTATIRLDGAQKVRSKASLIRLSAENLTDENSLGLPRKVAPVYSTLKVSGPEFSHSFPPHSLTVLAVAVRD